MDPIIFYIILFLIGFVASFVGNFVSGGISLISLSSMIFFGVSPQIAMSTYSIGSFFWRVGGFWQFLKARKIVWKLVLPLSIAALLGSAIGARILISVNESLFNKVAAILILLFIPLSLIKKNLGVKKLDISKTKRNIGYLLYFLLSIWAGFFAAGTGIFFLYLYMWFFGLTILEIKGTDKIPGMFLSLGATITFLVSGVVSPTYLLCFIPGAFVGSVLGAKYAIKLGDKWLRIIVLITIILMALKLFLT